MRGRSQLRPKLRAMIPTVLLIGLLAGLVSPRRGWLVVPAAAVGWMVALAAIDGGALSAGAALIALPNALVGVAVGAALGWGVAELRATSPKTLS